MAQAKDLAIELHTYVYILDDEGEVVQIVADGGRIGRPIGPDLEKCGVPGRVSQDEGGRMLEWT